MKKMFPVIVFAILIGLVLSSCTYALSELSRSQAEELAQTYFTNTYGKDAKVSFWRREQVAEDVSVWCIYVTIDDEDYELILDENDKPLADNYLCLNRIQEIESAIMSFEPLNSTLQLSSTFYYEDRAYRISCSVQTDQLLTQDQSEEYFFLLHRLKELGIERMFIEVSSPRFLLPEPERNLGIYGYLLCGELFYTDSERSDFNKQYSAFTDQFFWDEQAFSDKADQLSELGCKNIDFYISDFKVDSIVVSVYCEIETGDTFAITDELVCLNEDAFRIEGKSIHYKPNVQRAP